MIIVTYDLPWTTRTQEKYKVMDVHLTACSFRVKIIMSRSVGLSQLFGLTEKTPCE